ncbi:MAG: carbon storage regulator [Pirellulales bacterium]|nr:carbon storage regulator [Pirellulales bacterium]
MLVLSRRCDTAIHIGRNIKVTVLSIRKGEVRLGIDAPNNVRIWRDELCRADPALLDDEDRDIIADVVSDKTAFHHIEASDGPVF